LVLAIFVLLVVVFFKRKNKIPIAGFLFGYIVWFYDYDFLLNMGGPSTPISNYLCEQMGLHMCCCGRIEMLAPLLVLVLSCGAIGLLLWIPFYLYKRNSSKNV
jgi:hypothetical protein